VQLEAAEIRAVLEALYRDFNARDADAVLDRMTEDVEWPNGWEGGYVRGRDQVRDYWSRQWAEIDPTVTPVGFADLPDGRVDVTVHQVVRDRNGVLLSDSTVHHVYRFDAGQVVHMEIRQ
jgi:nuclear transport factor 2 (NTF2) superfamily protein